MREESPQSFPRPEQNNAELVHVYVKSELEKAGIALQQISKDGSITTNKQVPEEIKSKILQFAAPKGITIKFLTSA